MSLKTLAQILTATAPVIKLVVRGIEAFIKRVKKSRLSNAIKKAKGKKDTSDLERIVND